MYHRQVHRPLGPGPTQHDGLMALAGALAQGQQLNEITSLIESGVICPVVDKVFPFEKTADALAYVETGRARGKVVIAVKQ